MGLFDFIFNSGSNDDYDYAKENYEGFKSDFDRGYEMTEEEYNELRGIISNKSDD